MEKDEKKMASEADSLAARLQALQKMIEQNKDKSQALQDSVRAADSMKAHPPQSDSLNRKMADQKVQKQPPDSAGQQQKQPPSADDKKGPTPDEIGRASCREREEGGRGA